MLDKPPTPPATLAMARRVALEQGIRYAYVGNVHDVGRQSTLCHQCGERLIERIGYELGQWRLDGEGRCQACGTPVAGVFEGRPGTWGSQRRPVRLADFNRPREAQALAPSSPKLSVPKRKASKVGDQ